MEWFIFTSRLICRICRRLRLRCRYVTNSGRKANLLTSISCTGLVDNLYIYIHAFLYNLPRLFLSRRYYNKSLCVYADVLPISHNPSRRIISCVGGAARRADSARQAGISSANHSCFLSNFAVMVGRNGGVTGINRNS